MKRIEVVAAIIRKDDKIFATQRGYGEWKDGATEHREMAACGCHSGGEHETEVKTIYI